MTREEQLQFCRVCKNKKMDIHKGIVCGLTGEKGNFEETCPNYAGVIRKRVGVNRKEITEKELNIQREASVSGWLAFFLWVGVGGSVIGTTINTFIAFLPVGFTLFTALFCMLYIACYLVTAVLTINAFYQKKSNAVSLARTFVGLVLVDLVSTIIIGFIVDDFSDVLNIIRPAIWSCIWLTYLSIASVVENLIPSVTRTWERTEKVILSVFIVLCILGCGVTYYNVKSPFSGVLVSNDSMIESVIQEMNMALPDYSNPELTIERIVVESGKIVYTIRYNEIEDEFDLYQEELASELGKKEILCELVNGNDAEMKEFLDLIFAEGYSLCYRYLNSNRSFLYEVVISEAEYKEVLRGYVELNCNK